jgi:hypothetical protein
LLEASAAHQTTQERVAQRWSEVALYAIGCSRTEDAARAIDNARTALATSDAPQARLARSRLFLALSLSYLGRSDEVQALLNEVASVADLPQRIRELGSAVATLCAYALGAPDHRSVAAALERLHAHALGGFARVFASLPSRLTLAWRLSA